MDRLGQFMLDAGIITRDELARAVHVQRREGGRIGVILASHGACTRQQADLAWIDMIVRTPLEAAIDRACQGRFTAYPARDLLFHRVHRRDVIVEDMLRGGRLRTHENIVEGEAQLMVGGRASLPVTFFVDTNRGIATLDENGENIVRRWTSLIDRCPNTLARQEAAPAVTPDFEAKLSELLKRPTTGPDAIQAA